MRVWVLALVAVGCYSPPSYQACALTCDRTEENPCPSGLSCGGDGRCYAPDRGPCDGADAAPDGPVECFGIDQPPFQRICTTLATGHTLYGYVTTTGPCPEDVPSLPGLCIYAAQTLRVIANPGAGTSSLIPVGSRPLVLIGETLEVASGGVIDIAGHNTDVAAATPPAAASLCTATPGGSSSTNQPAAGGAGGMLGGPAGTGGSTGSAIGGGTGTFTPPTTLRGGCRGGDGGTALTTGGLGGVGGGAIYLLGNMLRIAGTINASGGGARHGAMLTGGGGGGAGGMVLLWSSQPITIAGTAQIFALGGGGGPGGSTSVVDPTAGNDPTSPTAPALNAAAANGAGFGGFGGTQAAGGNNGGSGTSGGGGGGGGSVGTIMTIPEVPAMPGQIAPDPS